jgi:hypothetical protein
MAKAKINPEFTYKTRDGQEVTGVHFTDVKGDDPYIVCAKVEGYPEFFTERGYYYKDQIHSLDLIKQPAKKPKPLVKPVVQKEDMENASTPEVKQQVVPSTQHIHHDMIVAWAKNPSKQVQCSGRPDDYWVNVEPDWDENLRYRFKPEKPKLLTIIGADGKARSYPEPCKEKPKYDTIYYYPSTTDMAHCSNWWDDCVDNEWFNYGIVHLTKEAAELHAKAMLGID